MIRLPQLDLQRDHVRRAHRGRTGKREDLAALDHLADGKVQQPVKVGVAVAVAAARPALPEGVDALVQRRIVRGGARPDASADDVVDQHLHSLGGHGVVADQIAHPVAQDRPSARDLLVGRVAGGAPAVRPAPLGSRVVAALPLDRVACVEPPQCRLWRKHRDGSVDQAETQGRRSALGHQDLR